MLGKYALFDYVLLFHLCQGCDKSPIVTYLHCGTEIRHTAKINQEELHEFFPHGFHVILCAKIEVFGPPTDDVSISF